MEPGQESAPFGGSVGEIGDRLDKIGKWDGVTPLRVVDHPYEDVEQYKVPFGTASFYRDPWKAYMDTMPASALLEIMGVNHSTNTPNEATWKLLTESGVKKARMEIPWNNFQYDGEEQVLLAPQKAQFDSLLNTFKKYGVRPLILLYSHHGLPTPTKTITVNVTQPAAVGDKVVYVTDTSQIKVNYTGFVQNGKAGYPLITAVDPATGACTLSATLKAAVPAGSNTLTILKYRPLGAQYLADGVTIDPDSKITLDAWLARAKYTADYVKSILGTEDDAGFDFEVWNEYTFGSEWPDLRHYYDNPSLTYPTPRWTMPRFPGSNFGDDILYFEVCEFIRENQNVYPNVKVIDGFSNQRPWEGGGGMKTDPDGKVVEWGYSRHLYTGYDATMFILDGNPQMKDSQRSYIDALGLKDGVANSSGGTDPNSLFHPSHVASYPEQRFANYQTENTVRDILPWDDLFVGHGRYTSPGLGQTAEFWMTEMNYVRQNVTLEIANKAGVNSVTDPFVRRIDEYMQAKSLLRIYAFYAAKGFKRIYIYSVRNVATFGIISEDFFEYLATNSNNLTEIARSKEGIAIRANRNMYNLFKDGLPISAPRKLYVDRIVEYKPRVVWTGDGTPNHPDKWHGDDLAIMPFQMSESKFHIGYYVVTRRLMHMWDQTKTVLDLDAYKMPDQDFEITLSNIRGKNAIISSYDPMTDSYVPVEVVSGTDSTLTVKVPAVDYPRFLVVQEEVPSALIQSPKLEKRAAGGGVVSFVPNVNGTVEISWGHFPNRGPSTFTEKYYSDVAYTKLVSTKTVDFLDYKGNLSTGPGAWIWTCNFVAKYSEKHTFYCTSSNRVSVWVDGIQKVNAAQNGSFTMDMEAGQNYAFEIRMGTPYTGLQTMRFYYYTASKPPLLLHGGTQVNKVTASVTANNLATIDVPAMAEGDGIKVKLTTAGTPVATYWPMWDWDVAGVLYSDTPVSSGNSDSTVPTDIILSQNTIEKRAGKYVQIGSFRSTDAGGGDHYYTLVSGTGSTHNGLFRIYGNQLRAIDTTSMTPGAYSIRVQSTDGYNVYQKALSVNVVDTQAPVIKAGFPTATVVDKNTANIKVNYDKAGTVYYVVHYLSQSSPSSVSQTRAGLDRNDQVAYKSGSVAVQAGVDTTINIGGLFSESDYQVYVMCEGNDFTVMQSTVSTASFSTPASPYSTGHPVKAIPGVASSKFRSKKNYRFTPAVATQAPVVTENLTTVFFDDFNRPDTTTGLGSPVIGNAYPATTNFRIYNGRMQAVNPSGFNDYPMQLGLGLSDYQVSFNMYNLNANTHSFNIRGAVSTNGFMIKMYKNSITIFQNNVTQIATVAATNSANPIIRNGDQIKIRAQGPLIRIYVNDVLVIETEQTFNQTTTGFSWNQFKNESSIGNFRVEKFG